MEEVKQSLQQKQENYKAVYLQKRTICNRQSVYISGEIQKRIMQSVGVITGEAGKTTAHLFKGLFLNSYDIHRFFSFGWLNIPFCISSR